jgi:hypothetical protein
MAIHERMPEHCCRARRFVDRQHLSHSSGWRSPTERRANAQILERTKALGCQSASNAAGRNTTATAKQDSDN